MLFLTSESSSAGTRVWLCAFKPQAVCSDDDTARELKLPPCCAELPVCVCVCEKACEGLVGRSVRRPSVQCELILL